MSAPQVTIMVLTAALTLCIVYRFFLIFERKKSGYETGCCKTIGSREIQMDYYMAEENENGLLAVLADGRGREAGGRIAAKTVIQVFQEIFDTYNMLDHPSYFFQKGFLTANREILKQMEEGRGMASASAVMVQDGFLFYGIVGNVKAAVYRNHELVSLGNGHTVDVLAEDKYYQGAITREDALSMLHEKRAYNYLGRDGFRQIEFYDEPIRLQKDDIIVLLSDGMYEGVTWKQIEDTLSQKKSCKKIALELVEAINQKKEDKDNASVILIRVGEPG